MTCFDRRIAMVMAGVFCLLMWGCGTVGFYSQAIAGQAEILSKAHPINGVLQDERVPGAAKQKLAVVQEARSFAGEHLGLPARRAFDRYSDLGRRHVSWVVFAAPEFSVEGKEWWYPVVGSLEYRGFFN